MAISQRRWVTAALAVGLVCGLGAAAAWSGFGERGARLYARMRRTWKRRPAVTERATVFLGDSLTHEGPFAELLEDMPHVVNRGVSGDTTADVSRRLDEIIAGRPRQLFLLIGTNDLLRGRSEGATLAGIEHILAAIKAGSPATALTLQSLPPANAAVNPAWDGFSPRAHALNLQLPALAQRLGARFVDLGKVLADSTGQLDPGLTYDGLHLKLAGYRRWVDLLR